MVKIHFLGVQQYHTVWNNMKEFTSTREINTPDEVWVLEHPPVYTLGQAGKAEHILKPNSIPIIYTDRGGQITYHGPGQLVAYILMNIRRRNIGIRTLVCKLEQVLVTLLQQYNISAEIISNAPGVYVEGKKIASIGLRVKNGCTYHGIALNVDMDLTPFAGINPCGYSGLKMTQIKDYIPKINIADVEQQFAKNFSTFFPSLHVS